MKTILIKVKNNRIDGFIYDKSNNYSSYDTTGHELYSMPDSTNVRAIKIGEQTPEQLGMRKIGS